jgi:hypothetical protein
MNQSLRTLRLMGAQQEFQASPVREEKGDAIATSFQLKPPGGMVAGRLQFRGLLKQNYWAYVEQGLSRKSFWRHQGRLRRHP